MTKFNNKLTHENENLRTENRDYKLLHKIFSNKQTNDSLEGTKFKKQSKHNGSLFENDENEN